MTISKKIDEIRLPKDISYKNWAFQESLKILDRIKLKLKQKERVSIRFETGYGPSGLPHIGTFCEVARTSYIITALKFILEQNNLQDKVDIELICFSDDMDGLKKIPSNIPSDVDLTKYIGQPLTSVPDPFKSKKSYGDYMNNKLRFFLDKFDFKYTFASATDMYKSGKFNETIKKVAHKYDQIMKIMLPSLGEERQKTYSPFLPICKKTNRVLQAKVLSLDLENYEIVYLDPFDNTENRVSILNGECKLQWKVDFAARWISMQIDYEMYGKDHYSNKDIYSGICRALEGEPPLQFFYELFLDSEGNKISKSKGNSISIDEWLVYSPIESLGLYVYIHPERAKKLTFDVIPKSTDDYIAHIKSFFNDKEELIRTMEDDQKSDKIHEIFLKLIENPVYLIHNSSKACVSVENVPYINLESLSFNLLLNLACACNPENKEVLWSFIEKYSSSISRKDRFIDVLINHAIVFYNNFVKPNKVYLKPNNTDIEILQSIKDFLISKLDQTVTEEEIQNGIYSIGKKYYEPKNLKDFFSKIYQILLGQTSGPRLGSFIKFFSLTKTIALIDKAIEGNL